MSTTPDDGSEPGARDEPTPAAVRDTYDNGRDTTLGDVSDDGREASEAERSMLATHRDPTLPNRATNPARAGRANVEFVRLPDLATRGAGHTLSAAQQLNQKLRESVREAVREQRDALRQRLAARAAEVSVTGPEHTQTPAPGREGVSR